MDLPDELAAAKSELIKLVSQYSISRDKAVLQKISHILEKIKVLKWKKKWKKFLAEWEEICNNNNNRPDLKNKFLELLKKFGYFDNNNTPPPPSGP